MRHFKEIYQTSVGMGHHRLHKGAAVTAISAFIAGLYVSFSGLLALSAVGVAEAVGAPFRLAWAVGSVLYPIGFLFVVLGKSELFTENFLYPVLAAWERGWRSGGHRKIVRLWSVGLVFNVIGVLVMVGLLSVSHLLTENPVLGAPVVERFVHYAEHTLAEPLWPMLWKAVFAGLLINFMSWLVAACEQDIARFIVVWITTGPIMLLGMHHSIVGSSEVLLGIFHGADASVLTWAWQFLLPVALGNHLGGVVFVAALHFLQSLAYRHDYESAGQ